MAIRAVTFDFWRTLFLTTNERERHRLRVKALADCTGASAEDAKRVMKQVMSEFLRVHIVEQRTLVPEDAIPMIENELKMTIAPETPKRATAHGPIQHSPINDAIALMLIALPDVAMSFLSSFIFMPHGDQQELPC